MGSEMCIRDRTVRELREAGWPVRDGVARWRLGELTVDWSAVAPASHPAHQGP